MKIGRNDPCPCGSGKKYKKCCLLKQDDPAASEKEELIETFTDLYQGFRNSMMMQLPHILEYKKIRSLHSEIIEAMVKYHKEGKFVQKIDPSFAATDAHELNGIKNLDIKGVGFDFGNDWGFQAFYDIIIYKAAPNFNCITEEFLKRRRYRKAEKVELLTSMLDSTAGIFEITALDTNEGFTYLREVFSGMEFKLTDIGLSSLRNHEKIYIYMRIITYRGLSFGAGISLMFQKDDSYIIKFIEENRPCYRQKCEFARFLELYSYYCNQNNRTKIIRNNLK